MQQQDFAATYGPLAQDVSKATGLAPEVVLGIIGQETGMGEHVSGNNVFGISPGGRVAAYPTVSAAAQAFVDLINSRYGSVDRTASPAGQAQGLVRAGYNTADPTYATKVPAIGAGAVAAGATAPSADDLRARLQQMRAPQTPSQNGTSPAAAPAQPPSADDLRARMKSLGYGASDKPSDKAPSPAPDQLQQAQGIEDSARGTVRNVAAGALEGVGGVGDFLTSPGAAIGKLAVTGGVTAVDALRRAFGYPGIPDDLRRYLLEDQGVGAPVSAGINWLGHNLPGSQSAAPADVPAATDEQQLARKMAGGATMMALGGGGPALMAAGAGGAGFGHYAGSEAPEWAQPGVETATNLLATGLLGHVAIPRPEPPPAAGRPLPGPRPGPEPPTIEGEVIPPSAGAGAASPAGAPRPEAAGAEATSEPIPPKTRAQELRDLEVAVNQSATDRAGPGMVDNTVYVPGVQRLLAARDYNQPHALDDKVARAQDPAYRQRAEAVERENNNIMVDLLRNDARDDIALDQAYRDREAVRPGPLHVFDNEQPVSAADVLREIDQALQSDIGKRDAVRPILERIRSGLFDRDGNLEEAPSLLYGVRQNITDYLKKGRGSGDEAAAIRLGKDILEGLLPTLDRTISEGAPTYGSVYLPAYRQASIPINQMEFLQKYQTGSGKLTGQGGNLQLSKVQKMLDDIYQGRSVDGIHPAKSLTQQQIDNVIAVRNELAALDLQDRLAKVKGSDTFQQIQRGAPQPDTPGRVAVRGATDMGVHALLALKTGGIGNAVYGGYSNIYRPARQAALQRKVDQAIAARKEQLLQTNAGDTGTP